jgi:RING finger and CHY zinc finger domain-containing protein 1
MTVSPVYLALSLGLAEMNSYSNKCNGCGVVFSEYHCSICNLWMSANEQPYHCLSCGFCRVGGRENFKHCDDCGMCIDAMLFDNHNCKAGKYDANCPVCQEDLFSSRQASHEMPCGHAIHWHCFKELTSFDTRCPVCKKTAETPEQMASTWSAIAMGIALQPVPPDLARLVNIICNDCEERDCERRWHFLGVRCMHCLSFNTVVEQILLQGREAAEYLDEQEAQRSGAHGVPTNIATLSLHAPVRHQEHQIDTAAADVDESMNSDSANDIGENSASTFPGMED